jgi:hypothetical protein
MPIWTAGQSASTRQLGHVPKTRVTTITLTCNGLMPKSAYTFWCNGVDMSWACRTPGTRMGAGLVSDEFGSITIFFSAEITPDYAPTSADSSKYHSMVLKNINGEVHSIGITPQALIGK